MSGQVCMAQKFIKVAWYEERNHGVVTLILGHW